MELHFGATTTYLFRLFYIDAQIGQLEVQLLRAKALDAKDSEDQSREVEVSFIKTPQIFGEACVLDVFEGVSEGSVIADTNCEVLCLHKMLLQTFHITEGIMMRIQQGAVAYPEDEDIIREIDLTKSWSTFKGNLLKDIHMQQERYNRSDISTKEPMEFTSRIS